METTINEPASLQPPPLHQVPLLDTDGTVSLVTIQPPAKYDVLYVNNTGIIDLEAESDSLLLSDNNIEAIDVKAVKQLLVNDKDTVVVVQKEPASKRRAKQDTIPVNYSHSGERMKEISVENKSLLRRLMHIAREKPSSHKNAAEEHDRRKVNAKTSAMARRYQEEQRIANENKNIYNRLQAVQPSSDVDQQKHEKEFKQSRKYLRNMANKKR